MNRRTMAVLLAAGALALGACSPQREEGPRGLPTPAQLQTPVPVAPSHPADPVIPTPVPDFTVVPTSPSPPPPLEQP